MPRYMFFGTITILYRNPAEVLRHINVPVITVFLLFAKGFCLYMYLTLSYRFGKDQGCGLKKIDPRVTS